MISILLILGGCNPSGSIKTDSVEEDTSAGLNDSGEVVVEPDPVPDLSLWIGERMFITDDCEEPAIEEGHELTAENWDGYEDAHNDCPNCDRIYYVEVSPDEICGVPVTTERYRGVDFNDGNGIAYVYDFGRNGASVVDPAATFDGWTLNYEYTYSDWLTLVGTVNFPEAETE
jgi:hypothetical protein